MKKLVIAVSLMTGLSVAHAGIMADLNSMFMSNSTAAGTLSTKDRTGVFGGSFSMRTPIHSVNIVAFDPPRLNAGCGGVDLYGGSFSFINGQQLIALFRNIASNAAGLAFKAAIQLISPSLSKLMTEFQSLLQSMNNLGKNSCALAHLIVDPTEKAISNSIDGDGSVGAVTNGYITDATAGLSSYMSNATSFFNTVGKNNPKSGNQVTKAIVASGSSGILGLAGLSNPDGSTDDASNPNSLNNEVLLSFMGYKIAGVPCNSANSAGTPDTTSTGNGAISSRIDCQASATLTLDDMVRGGGTGSSRPDTPLQLYTCLNPNGSGDTSDADEQICTSMQTVNLSYQGIQGWVNNTLFGSTDASTITPTSIVGLANGGVSAKYTAAQIQFIHQAGIPVVGLMSKTSDPATRIKIATMLSTPIVNCVAAEMGVAIYKAANGIQNNNTYDIGDDAKKNIERLRVDYLDKQKECLNDRSQLHIVQLLNLAASLNSKSTQ